MIQPIYTCKHPTWIAKLIPLSNNRPALREFCTQCGASSGGSNLGFSLPMTNDNDLTVTSSFKHKNKTLQQIKEKDPNYLIWLVTKSKSSDRIKKAAARVYFDDPYISPIPDSTYPTEKNMPSVLENSMRYIKQMKEL